MTSVVKCINDWAQREGIGINVAKSAVHHFTRGRGKDMEGKHIQCGPNATIPIVDTAMRLLGVWFDKELNMKDHVRMVVNKADARLTRLEEIADMLSPATARSLYLGAVHSILLYAVAAWWPPTAELKQMVLRAHETLLQSLSGIHARGARMITGCVASTRTADVLAEAHLRPLGVDIEGRVLKYLHRLLRHESSYPPRVQTWSPPPRLGYTSLKNAIKTWLDSDPKKRAILSTTPWNQKEETEKMRLTYGFTCKSSIRGWIPPEAEPPLVARLVTRPGTALYAPQDTDAAANVQFFTAPAGPEPRTWKKDDLSVEELAALNRARLRLLRDGARDRHPHWVLATDGSVQPPAPPREKVARTAGSAILVFDTDVPITDDDPPQLPDKPRMFGDAAAPGDVTAAAAAAEAPVAAEVGAAAVVVDARRIADEPPLPKTQLRHYAEDAARGDPRLCSYTSEILAMKTGLALFMKTVERAALAVEQSADLWIVTDSQSLLAALERGPCSVEDCTLAELWQLLLQVAAQRVVKLAFVYSHVGFELNELADKLADQAAKLLPEPAPHPISFIDAARLSNLPMAYRNAHHQVAVELQAEEDDECMEDHGHCTVRPATRRVHFRRDVLAGQPVPAAEGPLRAPRSVTTLLTQLRCGVVPVLRVWQQRRYATCPSCHRRISLAAMNNDPHGHPVAHIFHCAAYLDLRRTHLPPLLSDGGGGGGGSGRSSNNKARIAPWRRALRLYLWHNDAEVRKGVIAFVFAAGKLEHETLTLHTVGDNGADAAPAEPPPLAVAAQAPAPVPVEEDPSFDPADPTTAIRHANHQVISADQARVLGQIYNYDRLLGTDGMMHLIDGDVEGVLVIRYSYQPT
jgi:hypothetical protein